MRVAQIAPLTEPVPPSFYGGIERVVFHLTDELVSMGHDVTLFASGDSTTRAKLVAGWPRALRSDPGCSDAITPHVVMLEEVARRAGEFDILHFHFDYWYFLRFAPESVPVLTTLHGRLDLQAPTYEPLPGVSLVTISDAQREQLPQGRFLRTVYHGIRPNLLLPQPARQSYLAFLGRISPEKGVDKAIHIAGQGGLMLKIAAKVDPADRVYYESEIRPLIKVSPWVEFVGEINDAQKSEFLSRAHALLFPISWPEPFGLAMIESMACGTPVIAFDRGSVPEVVEDGLSGFVVGNEAAAVQVVQRLGELDRRLVRRQFDRRFTARRMAADYVSLYQRLCGHARVAVSAAAST
jgi:glycosyltransferase involved in cell wall biosynthesis